MRNHPSSSGGGGEIVPAEKLDGPQRTVMEMLLQGKSAAESASGAEVSRATIYRWMKRDPNFQAAYHQWDDEMRESCKSRLLLLADKAAGAVQNALEAADTRTAMALLKGWDF